MNPRRVVPFGLAVAALLAIAGIASYGHPLGSSRGGGPTATFFDYVLTTIVIASVIIAAIAVYAFSTARFQRWRKPERRRWHLLSTLAMFAAALGIVWLLSNSSFQRRLRAEVHTPAATTKQEAPAGRSTPLGRARSAQIRWDEVAIVAALIAALTAVALAARRSGPPRRKRWRDWHEAVSLALDESLDDLRTEPDLRRAIIAAYARMEVALGVAGLARRPAEAPLEYLARALQSLDTSATAVSRLTDLFEWAKFSQHAPDPSMRDEAIDALVAVRDELRRPEAAA